MEDLKISTIISNVYTDEDGYESTYGHHVFDNHPLAEIKNRALYLGNNKIPDYDIALFKSKIPCWYVLRDIDSRRFICGMDLLPNGKVWVAIGERDKEFNTIDEALQYAEKMENKKCFIVIEGELTI